MTDTGDGWRKLNWQPGTGNISAHGWHVGNGAANSYVMGAHFANGWTVTATGQLDPNGKPTVTSFHLDPTPPVELLVGVSSNLLRELPSGALLGEIREAVAEWEDLGNQGEMHFNRDAFLARIAPGRWPGRGAKADDVTYAALAFAYIDAIRGADTRPIETLAELMGCKRATASNRLAEARARDLLSSVGPGQSGGQLTEAAHRLLGLTWIADGGDN